MNQTPILRTALAAALAIALSTLPHPAEAQRSTAERQAAREQAQQSSPSTPQTLFPDATRTSPNASVSQRMAPRLNRLDDMLEGPENASEVIQTAQALIGDRNANAYVRSIAYVRMADAYEELGDLDNMFSSLESALSEGGFGNDNHFQTMLRLGQSLVIEDRTEEGLTWLARFFEESRSQRPEHLALMGNVYYQAERFSEAIEYLTRAIEAHDNPPSSWTQILMASYAETGQSDEAARVAGELARANPGDKQAVMNQAAILLQADQLSEAAEVLDGARSRGLLTDDRDYRQLASLYLNIEGREADAASVLQEGLDSGVVSADYDAYYMLGQAYYFSEQYAGAISAWTEAAKSAPDGETALNLARLHYEEGNMQEAKRYANEAIERGIRSPDNARAIIRNADIQTR